MLEPHDRGDEEWSIVVPREEGHLASGLGPGDRGQAQGPPVIVTDEFLFRESHVARWCATNSVPPTVANSHVFREKDVASARGGTPSAAPHGIGFRAYLYG